MWTRRTFLKASGIALVSASVGGSLLFLARAACAVPNSRLFRSRKVLVTIFQRGAMDGFMAVPKFNDPMLAKFRPRLRMSAARSAGDAALIDLDGTFGLHPALSPLASFYKEQRLAVVHGVGSPYATRSHSNAQTLAISHLEKFVGKASVQSKEASEAIKLLSKMGIAEYKPENGVEYPKSPLGKSLCRIAQLIKADVGIGVACAESSGWDTHVQQGTVSGVFARQASDLSHSITAFWNDLGASQDNVVLMTMTEFGRTVHENGSGGTDHGRASCLFVLGNNVAGGKVYGSVPDLVPDALEEGRDLPVTTDFRSVFSGVAAGQLGKEGVLFPDWQGEPLLILKG